MSTGTSGSKGTVPTKPGMNRDQRGPGAQSWGRFGRPEGPGLSSRLDPGFLFLSYRGGRVLLCRLCNRSRRPGQGGEEPAAGALRGATGTPRPGRPAGLGATRTGGSVCACAHAHTLHTHLTSHSHTMLTAYTLNRTHSCLTHSFHTHTLHTHALHTSHGSHTPRSHLTH